MFKVKIVSSNTPFGRTEFYLKQRFNSYTIAEEYLYQWGYTKRDDDYIETDFCPNIATIEDES